MTVIREFDLVPWLKSAFGVQETAELTPVIQADFAYGLNSQIWQQLYSFTVTAPGSPPAYGDIYTNNNHAFIVVYSSGTTLVCAGDGNPAASGNLTRVSGTGTTPIAFSAFTTRTGVVFGTGATIDTDNSRLRIQCGTSSTGYAYLLSRKPGRYRAGEGMTVKFTPLFTAGATNNIQLWGMGTIINNAPYDGYFFGYNGEDFGIVHYVRGAATWYLQDAPWNGDACDGTGPSGVNYNPTFGTPVMIKYPYLGYGDIFFYIQNPTTGGWILCHTIRYANTVNTTQLSNPTLNFMGFTKNSGNTTNKTMYCGSVGVFISGARSFVGNPKWAADNNKTGITAETRLLGIRNCTSYNGSTNRGLVRLHSLSVSAAANASGVAVIRLRIGAAIGGSPTYAAINGTTTDSGVTITNGNSIASTDTAGTTISGGIYIFNYTVAVGANGNGGQQVDLTPYDIFVAPTEILDISANSSSSATIGVSVNWSEDT